MSKAKFDLVRISICVLFVMCMSLLKAQMYFPPLTGDEWETLDPSVLGYCPDRIDSLYSFLEEKNSFSFIMLKEGRIVLEHYIGNYSQNSIWYWASAGKSLTAYLVGCAQEEGLLDLEDPTNLYLGEGWTSCTIEEESAIKIRHQLSMNSGLNDEVMDSNCLDPECLEYLVDPEERWAYYNAPYRLLLDVLSSASGLNINVFTNQQLANTIGMGGFWLDYVRWGKARDMARFGLLALNQGMWDTESVLSDTDYLFDMVHESQELNPAYGYLWWLNGGEEFMVPDLQLVFPGELIPDAPEDMYSALGLNDQKIYVVPGQDLVVVRQGNSAGELLAGPSSFDNQLWQMINALVCEPNGLDEFAAEDVGLFPNPVEHTLTYSAPFQAKESRVLDIRGVEVFRQADPMGKILYLTTLASGLYVLELTTERGIIRKSFMKY